MLRQTLTITAVVLLFLSLASGVMWAFSLSIFLYPIGESLISLESDSPWLGRSALLLLLTAMVLLLCATKIPATARVAGHCPNCNYDLTGNTSGVCPECGSTLTGR